MPAHACLRVHACACNVCANGCIGISAWLDMTSAFICIWCIRNRSITSWLKCWWLYMYFMNSLYSSVNILSCNHRMQIFAIFLQLSFEQKQQKQLRSIDIILLLPSVLIALVVVKNISLDHYIFCHKVFHIQDNSLFLGVK